MSQAASNPWHREALRVLPLAADLHTVDSEAALRVVLLGAGKADDIAERAVARAKAWATLAPLERALIDMLTGAPVTLPDMLAELRHALPDSWQAQLPDEHARTEIELTLVSLRARGLVQITGLDGEEAELLTAWGGFSEAERRESYGAERAPHTTRAAEAIQECIDRQLAAGTAKYVPIIVEPPVGEDLRALVEKAAEQVREFDPKYDQWSPEQAARAVEVVVAPSEFFKEIVFGGADVWARKWAARAHDAQASSAGSGSLVLGPEHFPAKERPRCARCKKPVESLACFDDGKTGGLRFAIVCHGETRDVYFYPAELTASGPQGTLIADRLAAAWGPST